jgi:hypothetical protein
LSEEQPDSRDEQARDKERRKVEPPEEAGQETPTVVAVLLAVAAVIAALIGARAALLGDSGSDTWHKSIREDVRRDAGIVEVSRFVYSEDAPAALQLRAAQIRGDEAKREARGESDPIRAVLEVEAAGQEGLANTVRQASDTADDPKYSKGEGYDVLKRLADERAEDPGLVAADPDATEERGSDRSRESSMLVATTILVAFAFLCGALAHGFPDWRRRLVPAGFAFAGVGLVAAVAIEVVM